MALLGLADLVADVHVLHQVLCWTMLVTGVIVFVALVWGPSAPYGRHFRGGWGIALPPRIAWVTQELPSLLVPLVLYSQTGIDAFISNPGSKRTLLALMLTAHYTYRTLIFPFLLRGGKPTPLTVWLCSVMFCIWNGFLQGWYIAHLPAEPVPDPLFLCGLAMWAFFWFSVMHADWTVIHLRKPGETGYKIPHGGMFEYVSAGNYASEILEWTGYALAAHSLPATAFAAFTFCNLAPRGATHHQWYKTKFDNYPRKRKAVIPFIW